MRIRMYSAYFVGLIALALGVTAQAQVKIQHWQTSNGARVYFTEAPELPIVDAQVVFDAGSARDGKLAGLALMTNGMLSEGAGKWNADDIAERFESVGAVYSNNSHRDMSVFSLRTLTDKPLMTRAVRTFATVLAEPAFPTKAFEREKERLIVMLEKQKQDPGDIASRRFYSLVYSGHPYATMPEGDIESIKALRVSNLRDFYNRYFVGRNATVAIVGALSQSEAKALAEDLVGNLKPGRMVSAIPRVMQVEKAVEASIEFPSSQSHILFGQVGLKRKDPDYFPLYLGNHILGGSGLVSILSDEIREKRGLSYSSYSYFSPMRDRGPFIMGLQTRNDQVEEALAVMKTTLKSFVDNGPGKEQLEAAKKNLTGGFALQVASNKSIVGYLAMIGFYQMPLDYLDTFIDNINRVSAESIKKAFQQRVLLDQLVTVVVGGSSEKESSR